MLESEEVKNADLIKVLKKIKKKMRALLREALDCSTPHEVLKLYLEREYSEPSQLRGAEDVEERLKAALKSIPRKAGKIPRGP